MVEEEEEDSTQLKELSALQCTISLKFNTQLSRLRKNAINLIELLLFSPFPLLRICLPEVWVVLRILPASQVQPPILFVVILFVVKSGWEDIVGFDVVLDTLSKKPANIKT